MESRSHLGELSRYLGELFHYLQDPHLVARFQRICGVHGTFSGPAGSSKVGQRTDLHTSGARCRHARVGKESAGSPFEGAGEGDNVRRTEPEVRKSSDTNLAEVHEEKYDVRPQNGCAATSGGQTVGAAGEGGSLRGATDGGRTRTGVADPPGSSTVKPRRKNSLTGDAGQEFVIENRFLYYLFSFGTELGNELFYIIFFPFLTWNLEAFVSRRLVMVWVWVMYLGQCTKDVIGWSRPASPPVVKVEMFYNSEYSMPSTHAMSGTAIPFALFFMTCSRWEYPDILGFSLALCWCLLVCVSRIYMGMHSVLDVIVGVLYSALILILFLPVLDLMDSFNLTCRYAPLVVVSLHLGLGLFSFTLDTWSTSRGDTAQILGVGVGVALASHLNHQLGLMPDPSPEQLPFAAPELSVRLAAVAALRLTVGVCVLLTTRALMKAVTIPLVCRVSGVSSGDIRKARQHMEVELPYRFIVYGTLGFSMQFLVPLLFRHMQLP